MVNLRATEAGEFKAAVEASMRTRREDPVEEATLLIQQASLALTVKGPGKVVHQEPRPAGT